MTKMIFKYVAIVVFALTLSACGREEEQGSAEPVQAASDATEALTDSAGEGAENAAADSAEWLASEELIVAVDTADAAATDGVLGDIPYPVYPNGAKYRVGGENGLKIVLFQTEDSFEEVDAYYQAQAEAEAGMPRLSAMNDYVRYSTAADDDDPWETTRPGIVIHEFNNETEREAVGASDNARTNIIMSFE